MSAFRPPDGAPRPPGARVPPGLTPAPMRGPDALVFPLKWARKLSGFDAWTVACLSLPPGVNCPSPHGPDFDFPGSGPNLLHVRDDDDDHDVDEPQGRGRRDEHPEERGHDLVGIGQKSGIYWALNPDNGATRLSGGGVGGRNFRERPLCRKPALCAAYAPSSCGRSRSCLSPLLSVCWAARAWVDAAGTGCGTLPHILADSR